MAGRHDAISDGFTVLGYLHWSALDNDGWGSYRPTFGLIAVDRDTFVRSPTPSLSRLGDVAKAHGIVAPKV